MCLTAGLCSYPHRKFCKLLGPLNWTRDMASEKEAKDIRKGMEEIGEKASKDRLSDESIASAI